LEDRDLFHGSLGGAAQGSGEPGQGSAIGLTSVLSPAGLPRDLAAAIHEAGHATAESGTIYVLQSLSSLPAIAERREIIHRIGVTGVDVDVRTAGAEMSATYLFAGVKVVATYRALQCQPQPPGEPAAPLLRRRTPRRGRPRPLRPRRSPPRVVLGTAAGDRRGGKADSGSDHHGVCLPTIRRRHLSAR